MLTFFHLLGSSITTSNSLITEEEEKEIDSNPPTSQLVAPPFQKTKRSKSTASGALKLAGQVVCTQSQSFSNL